MKNAIKWAVQNWEVIGVPLIFIGFCLAFAHGLDTMIAYEAEKSRVSVFSPSLHESM